MASVSPGARFEGASLDCRAAQQLGAKQVSSHMGEATRSRRRQGQSMRQALTTASQIREATINKKFRYQRGGTHYRYELAIALTAFEQKYRAEQPLSPGPSFDRKRENRTWQCPPGCDSIDLRPCLDSVAPVHFVTRERSRGVILAHVAGSHHNLLFKFVSEGRCVGATDAAN